MMCATEPSNTVRLWMLESMNVADDCSERVRDVMLELDAYSTDEPVSTIGPSASTVLSTTRMLASPDMVMAPETSNVDPCMVSLP